MITYIFKIYYTVYISLYLYINDYTSHLQLYIHTSWWKHEHFANISVRVSALLIISWTMSMILVIGFKN